MADSACRLVLGHFVVGLWLTSDYLHGEVQLQADERGSSKNKEMNGMCYSTWVCLRY